MKAIIFLLSLLLFVSCSKTVSNDHFAKNVANTPVPFLPDIFTGEHNEFNVSFNPVDSKQLLFTRRIGDGKQKIYETYYKDGQWTTPQIASFSTDRDEIPMFAPDGETVYFGSEREIPGRPNLGSFDMNIWKTTYSNGTWSDAIPLPPHINKVQAEGDEWPLYNLSYFTTADGIHFFTGTLEKGENGIDIYTSALTNDNFSPLQKLPPSISSEEFWEYAPILTPDGKYLFTQVYNKTDGLGGDDIYVSKKDANGNWLPSKNLGPLVNSTQNECPAGFSPDGKYFIFLAPTVKETDDPDAIGRPYIVKTSALKLDELFK